MTLAETKYVLHMRKLVIFNWLASLVNTRYAGIVNVLTRHNLQKRRPTSINLSALYSNQ